jgi:ribosomal protein S18 acetylase RimI-like enzyme
MAPWDEAAKEAFLRSQFALQASQYRLHYPDAAFKVILAGGERIGRLYVHRTPGRIHILDIALIPECRNQGVGSTLLREILDQADHLKSKVILYVENYNPALRLYERLGFRRIAEEAGYEMMERLPAA